MIPLSGSQAKGKSLRVRVQVDESTARPFLKRLHQNTISSGCAHAFGHRSIDRPLSSQSALPATSSDFLNHLLTVNDIHVINGQKHPAVCGSGVPVVFASGVREEKKWRAVAVDEVSV